jgi:peptide deformylase
MGDVADEDEETEKHELSAEERATRDAALKQIVQLGDPVLRSKAVEVRSFDADLVSLGAHMVTLMDDAIGVGLAAPQIGRPVRMFVYRVEGDGAARAIINPVVEPLTEETETAEEGCLSLVGIHVPVSRPTKIRLRGQTADGKPIDEEIEGFSARIVQHENDHLDGVLILERTTPEYRRAALKALASGEPMVQPESATEADASEPAEPAAPAEPASELA